MGGPYWPGSYVGALWYTPPHDYKRQILINILKITLHYNRTPLEGTNTELLSLLL